ncbi:putative quinol monooxygenase [Streptomyces sp. OR43]|uniref:putative quinol monooxygenase n=1 Tax=Streptomyces sp. or43 TaxID=2478957 RepID=UPI001C9BDABC|nr:antibiotic biosynthesis monooxygenase [Streptomyces sp. or43]
MIDPSRPGKVLRFKAKPGKGDELLALCAKLSDKSPATDKVVIARAEDDPDTLWAMEFFKSDKALAAQDTDPNGTSCTPRSAHSWRKASPPRLHEARPGVPRSRTA